MNTTLKILSVYFCFFVVLCSCKSHSIKESVILTYYPFKIGNYWGCMDTTCNFKLQPKFEFISEFSEKKALVLSNGKYAYIDDSCVFKTNFNYTDATLFSESKAFVVDSSGALICLSDKFSKLFTLKNVQEVDFFSEGLAAIKKNNKFGFIDTTGSVIIEPKYDQVLSFSDGLCAVASSKIKGDSLLFSWSFIDKAGKVVLKGPFLEANGFEKGLASVKFMNGNSCWIDKLGKNVFNVSYKECRSFSEEVAIFRDTLFYGIINRNGTVLLKPTYISIGNFSDGLASIEFNEHQVGYIDTHGKIVIKPVFQFVSKYSQGIAYVCKDEKLILINKAGLPTCDFQFDSAPGFLGKGVGFIDLALNKKILLSSVR